MKRSDPSRAVQNALRDRLVAAALREPDPARTTQTALRDALVAVAVAPAAAEPAVPLRRPRRRRWKTAGVVAFALLGVAAAAEATRLISIGTPIGPFPDWVAGDPRLLPDDLGVEIVVTAPDRERRATWALGVYTSGNGNDCALPGQLLGRQLGLEEHGVFRPYSDLKPGACGNLERLPMWIDAIRVTSDPARTIVFGRTAHPDRELTFSAGGGPPQTTRTGRGGGFLFVFEGIVEPADLSVFPTEP